MTRASIVVVGGGPAGIACALAFVAACPERAEDIVVLDRAVFPREKPCAGGLGGRGEAVLRALHALPDVPHVRITAASLQGALGFRRVEPTRNCSTASAADSPAVGRVVRRFAFDSALVATARARGIVVTEGCSLHALEERAECIRVSFTDRNGAAKTLDADVVVGADGVGSLVRKSLGLPRGLPYAQVVECDTEEARGDRPRDELHFDTRDRRYHGYAWDFPTLVGSVRPSEARGTDEPTLSGDDGEQRAVCRGVYVVRWEGCDEAGVRDPGVLLEERLAAIGAKPLGPKRKRYAERGWLPGTPLASRRRLLVGEAAGIDPVTGEGIAQALEGGALAGKYLAAQLRSAGSLEDVRAWSTHFARSRLGRDLTIRSRGLAPFFGRSRDAVEELLLRDEALLDAATRHFAGLPLDRLATTRALLRGAAAGLAYRLQR